MENKEEIKTADGLKIAEDITAAVAEIGVTLIISDLVAALMPSDVKKIGKIARLVGSAAIEGATGGVANNYIRTQFARVRTVIESLNAAAEKIEKKETENGSIDTAGSEA